ncbi:low-complexity tail membrane protein [Pseudanabaena sp. 'Roaring Creek']|uniref:low-complexity tail membrane protein n=1 Tax=Pseudanabaena sp. 'Roaring Creek' TaxID=1681830 RepID=UPI0006D7A279|nr:low-complexity tail membrane protein [Pseudanabaena sp. 'Roaring Creek']
MTSPHRNNPTEPISLSNAPFLWGNIALIAGVPWLMALSMAGLAVGDPVFPEWFEIFLLGFPAIALVTWVQWQQPISPFSLWFVSKPVQNLSDRDRRILTLLKQRRNGWYTTGWIAAAVALLMSAVFCKIYIAAPLAQEIAPFPTGLRLLGVVWAEIFFLLSNILLQSGVSALRIKLTDESELLGLQPFAVEKIKNSFTTIGWQSPQLLKFFAEEAIVPQDPTQSQSAIIPELQGSPNPEKSEPDDAVAITENIDKNIENIADLTSEPAIKPEIEPVIESEIEPVIEPEIKPVIESEIEPVIESENAVSIDIEEPLESERVITLDDDKLEEPELAPTTLERSEPIAGINLNLDLNLDLNLETQIAKEIAELENSNPVEENIIEVVLEDREIITESNVPDPELVEVIEEAEIEIELTEEIIYSEEIIHSEELLSVELLADVQVETFLSQPEVEEFENQEPAETEFKQVRSIEKTIDINIDIDEQKDVLNSDSSEIEGIETSWQSTVQEIAAESLVEVNLETEDLEDLVLDTEILNEPVVIKDVPVVTKDDEESTQALNIQELNIVDSELVNSELIDSEIVEAKGFDDELDELIAFNDYVENILQEYLGDAWQETDAISEETANESLNLNIESDAEAIAKDIAKNNVEIVANDLDATMNDIDANTTEIPAKSEAQTTKDPKYLVQEFLVDKFLARLEELNNGEKVTNKSASEPPESPKVETNDNTDEFADLEALLDDRPLPKDLE